MNLKTLPARLMLRDRVRLACCACATVLLLSTQGRAQEKDFDDYPEHVVKYLGRLFDEEHRQYAFRDDYSGGVRKWRSDARPELRRLVGLEKIAASVGRHKPQVELDEPEDLGDYLRQRGTIETEPDVRIPFW
ncbi:unnamed protein product, partial [marine sediment metagenome]